MKIFKMNVMVPFLLDADLIDGGVRVPISWNPEAHPHLLIVGATGSGKTYAEKLLLGKISKYNNNASIYVLDFKAVDFGFLKAAYYPYLKYADGIRRFYKEFHKRLQGDTDRRPLFCLLEEYGAFITSSEKKEADEIRKIISEILFLGRSLRCHIICGLQRADAVYFQSGARDQFSAILALGNISKEQKQMLFSDFKDEMSVDCGRGQGYFYRDGKGLKRVIVPIVRDMSNLETAIKQAVIH